MDSRSAHPGPAEPSSQPDLERQIYSHADDLVRLLGQVRGPARNVLKRAVVESIREVPADVPVEEPKAEPGNQNFGAFGLMVLVLGVLFMPVIPSMAFACLIVGALILLLSFLATALSSRSSSRRTSETSVPHDSANE